MTTAVAPRRTPKAPARPVDPATAYARDVVAGRIVAGVLVRRACERHLRDLKDGHKRGLRFDVDAAQFAIDFFETVLHLAEGEFAGKPFILQPFELFMTGALFGWKKADGTRRFNTAYIESGKGSGKTPWAAGVGLFGLVADGEIGAEIYSAATTYSQASICFRDAKLMVEASPALTEMLDVTEYNIANIETNSFMRPISSERKQLSGPRVHIGIIDEIHEHPNAEVVNKLTKGIKNRRQPLMIEITNSGVDRHSICRVHHEYSEKVLAGIIEDDSWFAYVCQLDACDACQAEGRTAAKLDCPDCDDWRDEKVWLKVNPGLDTILPRRYLRDEVKKAEGMPSELNTTLRLNFCVWTEQSVRWMPMAAWDACVTRYKSDELLGEACFGGLDLARVKDLSAFAKLFPPSGDREKWRVLMRYWCPEEDIEQRSARDRVPYVQWAREGWITATPGNTTDYKFIQSAILEDAGAYDVREIAFDRTFAGEIVQNLLEENVTMVEFGQGFLSMAAPTAELLRLVLSGEIEIPDDPVLRWAASNMVVKVDPAGNWKPDKEHSTERIDPVVAILDALGRAQVHVETKKGISLYVPDEAPA